jgi:hypothetical protein
MRVSGPPYAPRTTQESYRPRASDRTMVGNSATVTLVSFGIRFGRSQLQDHARRRKPIASLRTEKQIGIACPSKGLDARYVRPTLDHGRSISLDIPFNRTFRGLDFSGPGCGPESRHEGWRRYTLTRSHSPCAHELFETAMVPRRRNHAETQTRK